MTFIKGEAGKIEIRLEEPSQEKRGLMVICHPHPQGGGTLDNKVVHTLARAARDSGLVACRFNFRGVGASEGSFADGEGELQDCLSVIAFLQQTYPDLPVQLAGFSFGGAIALQAAAAPSIDCRLLILVAPAIGAYGSSGKERVDCPVHVFQGLEDELIPADSNRRWAAGSVNSVVFHAFEETGHFFHRKLVDLKQRLGQILDE